MLNLNSDARRIRAISEAAIQYRFYDKSDDALEVVNSFVLLVATKNKYRDVLGKLVGNASAMGSQLDAPETASGVNLTSKIQTLAENLASGLTRGREASAAVESKGLPLTLLQWALEEGIGPLIEILAVIKDAVITADDMRFHLSLHDVVRGGHGQTMMLVLSQQGLHADTSVREQGHTALQMAAREGNLSGIAVLLEAGADVNAPPAEYMGRSALQAAAGGGHQIALDMLLKAGADVNAPPTRFMGRTALQAAAGGGHQIALDMLLKAGADVNAPPAEWHGLTALQAAASGGHQITLGMLLKAGADVNAEPAQFAGRTALQAAKDGGNQTVLEMLRMAGASK